MEQQAAGLQASGVPLCTRAPLGCCRRLQAPYQGQTLRQRLREAAPQDLSPKRPPRLPTRVSLRIQKHRLLTVAACKGPPLRLRCAARAAARCAVQVGACAAGRLFDSARSCRLLRCTALQRSKRPGQARQSNRKPASLLSILRAARRPHPATRAARLGGIPAMRRDSLPKDMHAPPNAPRGRLGCDEQPVASHPIARVPRSKCLQRCCNQLVQGGRPVIC